MCLTLVTTGISFHAPVLVALVLEHIRHWVMLQGNGVVGIWMHVPLGLLQPAVLTTLAFSKFPYGGATAVQTP
jgi:hypothetical protein